MSVAYHQLLPTNPVPSSSVLSNLTLLLLPSTHPGTNKP